MKSGLVLPFAIFLTAMVLYVATLAPSVEWGDFGGYDVMKALLGDSPGRAQHARRLISIAMSTKVVRDFGGV